MSFIILIAVFLISCLTIYFAGEWLVDGVMNIARYLGWKEFVLSFLVMAFFGSLSSLFVGISSAFKGIPELSIGEIMSSNIIDLTLVLALPIFLTGRAIKTESRTINVTLFFTLGAAVLPMMLLMDGLLSRADGVILIFFYFSYIFWLFAKKERFTKPYDEKGLDSQDLGKAFIVFLEGLGKTVLGIGLLVIAAQGVVWSAEGLALNLHMPLILVGIFIVGFGSALPELYFTIKSAEKQNNYMILGNIMGAVITPATLILGIVALICPVSVDGLTNFTIARIFLLLACALFFVFSRTDKKITKGESFILIAIYIVFLIAEIVASVV